MRNINWNSAFPEAPKNFKNKVITTLNTLPDKEKEMAMLKRRSIKRSIVFVAAIVMALGLTAFASGKISSMVSSSSSTPDYKTMPSAEEVKQEIGISPILIEKFKNGYTFGGATIDNCEAMDEDGNSLGKFKGLSIDYQNSGDEIYLSMEPVIDSQWHTPELAPKNYNGIDLYYHSYQNKSVPGDYKLTEQDKKDEADGKYVFSYGSDEIEVSTVQSVIWQSDGIGYCLLGIDSSLEEADMISMAQEIVDKK